MQTKKSKRILPRSAVLTLLLLVAAGLSISAFSLALSGWNGVSWAGNPTLFFWNTLPLRALTAVGMVSLVCFDYIYPDDQRYTALAGEHAQDEREAYAATGVVYPFFHSAGDYLSSSSSYDERAARQTYNQYTDGVIPPEKKVNLISIQMEAFADLSLYDIDGLSPEVYRTSTSSRPRAIPAPSSPTSSPGAPPRPSGLSSPGATSTGILRPRPIPWPGT